MLYNFDLYVIIILSASVHEAAHAWMAARLGDPTARILGRLSLWPHRHMQVVPSVILPLVLLVATDGKFMLGWCRPVPVTVENLRHADKDMARIAIAGPAVNLAIAALAAIFGLQEIVWVNLSLVVLNLLPIPPLDGAKIAKYYGNLLADKLKRR